MGLSYKDLCNENPRLIVCDVSGYGSYGPYRDKKAYDLLIQSEAGFVSVTGGPGKPAKAGISIADIASGMYAYTNILTALIERDQTGKGKRIDISILESMVEWMNFPLYYSMNDQPVVPRTGVTHATVYPYGPFDTAGGESVMFGVQLSGSGCFCAAMFSATYPLLKMSASLAIRCAVQTASRYKPSSATNSLNTPLLKCWRNLIRPVLPMPE